MQGSDGQGVCDLGHPLARKQSGDGDEPMIKPDYSKDLNEVYAEVTKLCLDMVGTRALVAVEHDTESLEDGYPSWVTRWHINNKPNKISRLPDQHFRAGGPPVVEPPRIEGSTLRLRGTTVDTLWRCFRMHVDSAKYRISFSDVDGQQLSLDKMLAFLATNSSPWYDDNHGESSIITALGTALCCGRPEPFRAKTYFNGLSHLVALEKTRPADRDQPDEALVMYFCFASLHSSGRSLA